METSVFSTPCQLVEGIHASQEGARAWLFQWLQEPISRLMDRFIQEHDLPYSRDFLSRRAIHSLEIYLRTRKPAEFDGLSWPAFRAALLLNAAKMAFLPFRSRPLSPEGKDPSGWAAPPSLPASSAYLSQTFYLPWERIGPYWVGGDWFAGAKGEDDSLWVMLADVSGHGYCAYLLALHLPQIWRMCWEGRKSQQPVHLLQALHNLLGDCLPEGVYVEGLLARFGPEGEVTVAPAGGYRLLLGNVRQHILHTLKGPWLGLFPPELEDQQTWKLQDQDELVMGSDGLFDQLSGNGKSTREITAWLSNSDHATLFDLVHHNLQEALSKYPQLDDITMVTVRRLEQKALVCL